jgi:hypothetical protein
MRFKPHIQQHIGKPMSDHENPSALDEEVFTYLATKDGRVLISFHGKQVTTLSKDKAKKFLSQVEGADDRTAQLVMAKATGQFKHGNERVGKQSRG